jgi:hypothetical protein
VVIEDGDGDFRRVTRVDVVVLSVVHVGVRSIGVVVVVAATGARDAAFGF